MTRRAPVPVQERTLRIARAVYEGTTMSALWIRCTFGVDERTARRDMQAVECYLPLHHLPTKGQGRAVKRLRMAR